MSFLFGQHDPPPDLAPFVEAIWWVRGGGPYAPQTVLPNGCVELMVNFGPTQHVHAYGLDAVDETFRRAWLAGQQDQRLVIASPRGADHLSIRFRPWGAHAFLGLSLDGVTNRVVELDALLGEAAGSLRDRLGAAPTDADRVREAVAWLRERRGPVHPHVATIQRAVALLRESDHALGIGELCARLGLSNRHLAAQFRTLVGLTPKRLARVERFRAVVRAAGASPPGAVDWSRLAYRFHFSDQAHLVREFRRMSGVTPTAFLARRAAGDLDAVDA